VVRLAGRGAASRDTDDPRSRLACHPLAPFCGPIWRRSRRDAPPDWLRKVRRRYHDRSHANRVERGCQRGLEAVGSG
jgi:hypothetical protein